MVCITPLHSRSIERFEKGCLQILSSSRHVCCLENIFCLSSQIIFLINCFNSITFVFSPNITPLKLSSAIIESMLFCDTSCIFHISLRDEQCQDHILNSIQQLWRQINDSSQSLGSLSLGRTVELVRVGNEMGLDLFSHMIHYIECKYLISQLDSALNYCINQHQSTYLIYSFCH